VASNRRWKSILCAWGQEIEELESADAYVLLFAGYLTFASGEPKSAASFLLEAVKDSTLLPQEYVLDAKNLLGQILFMEGKTDGAVWLLGDIITDSQTALGLTHAITLSALRSLGFAHFNMGNKGAAAQVLEITLEGQLNTVGYANILTRSIVDKLFGCYLGMEKDSGWSPFRRLLERFVSWLGEPAEGDAKDREFMMIWAEYVFGLSGDNAGDSHTVVSISGDDTDKNGKIPWSLILNIVPVVLVLIALREDSQTESYDEDESRGSDDDDEGDDDSDNGGDDDGHASASGEAAGSASCG